MPMANTQANRAQRDGSPPNPTMAARTSEKTACSTWRTIRSSRRSNRSANIPPNSPREQQRAQLGEGQQPDERARAREVVGVGAQDERLHPGADVRRERPDPHPPEGHVRQRRQHRARPSGAEDRIALAEGLLGFFEGGFGFAVQGHRRRAGASVRSSHVCSRNRRRCRTCPGPGPVTRRRLLVRHLDPVWVVRRPDAPGARALPLHVVRPAGLVLRRTVLRRPTGPSLMRARRLRSPSSVA